MALRPSYAEWGTEALEDRDERFNGHSARWRGGCAAPMPETGSILLGLNSIAVGVLISPKSETLTLEAFSFKASMGRQPQLNRASRQFRSYGGCTRHSLHAYGGFYTSSSSPKRGSLYLNVKKRHVHQLNMSVQIINDFIPSDLT